MNSPESKPLNSTKTVRMDIESIIIKVPATLIAETPNDQELGSLVRKMFHDTKLGQMIAALDAEE